MRGVQGRWAWLRRRRAAKDAAGTAVGRRTLLVGAAASAGAVAAAGVSPAGAGGAVADAAAASAAAIPRSAFGGGGAVAASDVSVVPAGEIIDTDAQAVLEALDRRLSKVNVVDDLQVAMTLVDDFMGNTTTSGTIGQLGWAVPLGTSGTAAAGLLTNDPGTFLIGTGTATDGWHSINLGNTNLKSAPVLMCEWRFRVSNHNDGSNTASYWFGLHDHLKAGEPSTGFYVRYSAADGPNWQAVCANGGSRTVVDTGVAVNIVFHRFRITSDGGGIARFYIDSNLVATITTNLPSGNRYSPCVGIRKTGGTTERKAAVDYFALRYEHIR
jgi:hypothetical protein